ncbi:Craniofacial development protein 1 [Linum perenne]
MVPLNAYSEDTQIMELLCTSDEAKKLAAAALSAVKDAAAAAAIRGKVEITDVRDFAGRDIEVKKLVDAESKEAAEKGKSSALSTVDAVLEQIKKKQKRSVLDKTKKDWGELNEENKGLEDELQIYKKSSNHYLERVSFLQRTDYKEIKSKI